MRRKVKRPGLRILRKLEKLSAPAGRMDVPILTRSDVEWHENHWEISNKSTYFISVLRCNSSSQGVPVELLADCQRAQSFPSIFANTVTALHTSAVLAFLSLC